ncbi:MAG: hypothetical protein AAF349_15880 [Cyanobacteria bacterium P01_A01_bin.68]
MNHSLFADKIWYGRCVNQPFSVSGLDEELCSDRKQLETEIKINQRNGATSYSKLMQII